MSPRKLRVFGLIFIMESDKARVEEEVSDSSSSINTHRVFEALRPSWPKIHLDVDIPGWFIIAAAIIIGLRGTC